MVSRREGAMARKDSDRGTRLTAARRRVLALELRKAGASVRAIADQLGAGKTTIARDLQRALADLLAVEVASMDELRALELARLDAALVAIWPKVRAGDLLAVDRLVRLSKRRSELLGLDAPVRVDIAGYIRQLAEAEGLDPEEAVSEAERIVREAGLDR
jgi:hypothetical protein